MHSTDLYIGRIQDPPVYRPVLPEERQAMLDGTRNERVRAQRFYAWDALLKGLRHSRGLDAKEAKLSKNGNGKWASEQCGISISHCGTAVAAAVSDGAVGVDIEPLTDARYRPGLLQRIATEEEQRLFPSLPADQRVAVLWTRKEASYKRGDRPYFSPIAEDAAEEHIRTVVIRMEKRAYAVSVASGEETALRVFEIDGNAVSERKDCLLLQPFDGV